VTEEIRKSVLPFSTLSQDREEPFSKETEKATLFCLAELERAKGGGLVLKHPPEKLDFIAKVCYPFWLVTLDEIGLLFDGLNTTSETLTYLIIPDIQVFIDDLKRSSITREAYMTFLSDNLNFFQASSNKKEKVIDGLIIDPEFLHEFNLYLTEVTQIEASLSNTVKVSPTLDESLIASNKAELQNLKSKFEGEVDALYKSMKLLKAKTTEFLKVIRDEIKEIEGKFNKEIEKSQVFIAEDVKEIRKKYDEEVTEYSKEAEEKLLSLQQEKIKLEKTKEKLTEEIEHCKAEIETCAINKDDVGERKWKEERNELKGRLSETEKELNELNRLIKEIRDDKTLKIFDLKSERDSKIKEAERDIVEIEASRDAKIRIYKEEMEKFEELTSSIIERIDELAKLREKAIDEFNKLGIQQKQEKHTLVYMPFYLLCYKSESRKRYVPFPPSIVNSVSFSVKIKGALGKSKIKQLLQPRSKAIVTLLNKFPPLMEQNPVFNREMNEACTKINMLRTKESRKPIKTGLKELQEEGWFSKKEYEIFSETLENVE